MAGGSSAGSTRWAQPVASSENYRPAKAPATKNEPVVTAPLLGVLANNGYIITDDPVNPEAFFDTSLSVGPLTPGRLYFVESTVLVSTTGVFEATRPLFSVRYGPVTNIRVAYFQINRIDISENPNAIRMEYSLQARQGDTFAGHFSFYLNGDNNVELSHSTDHVFDTETFSGVYDFPADTIDFDLSQVIGYSLRFTEENGFTYVGSVGNIARDRVPGNQYPGGSNAGTSSIRLRYAGPVTDNGTTGLYWGVAEPNAFYLNSIYEPFDMLTYDPETQGVNAATNQFVIGVNYGATTDLAIRLQANSTDPGRSQLVHRTSFIRATDIGAVAQIT